MSKLEFLLNESNVGKYNKCEVIEIFGFNKNTNESFNIFTLIVFEYTNQKNKCEYITKKQEKFRNFKHITWGIKRHLVTIDKIKEFYLRLKNENIFSLNNQDRCNISSLRALSLQSIFAKDSFESPHINKVLKNNFIYGSYILEFFDESKDYCNFLIENEDTLKDFKEKLNSYYPLDLGNLFDRLGNVLFQLPKNNIQIDFETRKNIELNRYSGITIFIESDNTTNYLIRIYEEIDGNISIQKIIDEVSKKTEIDLDDCYGTIIEIFDKKTSLLIYKNKFNIFKNFSMSTHSTGITKRTFLLKNKKIEVPISNVNNQKIIRNKDFNSWIGNRNLKNELKTLEENQFFIQYFGKENDDIKALSDIRKLITQYGDNGIYLWDPYLSVIDIKNTLYYSKIGIELKAITGLKQPSRSENEILSSFHYKEYKKYKSSIFLDFHYSLLHYLKLSKKKKVKENMVTDFLEDKGNLLLDLEVRAKYDNSGYEFHDRFLIFPTEPPRVWSLGTSINSLGKAHHIIQEVKHARLILNAFNELWDNLDGEECLVWKSK